jgi:hypothetical protein
LASISGALGREEIRLAVETVLEIVRHIEDEIRIVVEVHHRRTVGHRDVARGLGSRTVEMLMEAIERDREHRARLPFEADALALAVPDRGRTTSFQHQHHLLEQLALGRERFPRRNLADIAIVRSARGFVIDIDTAPAAPRPGLQLDRAQIGHVMGRDDIQPLGGDPADVGRILVSVENFLASSSETFTSLAIIAFPTAPALAARPAALFL